MYAHETIATTRSSVRRGCVPIINLRSNGVGREEGMPRPSSVVVAEAAVLAFVSAIGAWDEDMTRRQVPAVDVKRDGRPIGQRVPEDVVIPGRNQRSGGADACAHLSALDERERPVRLASEIELRN